MFKHYLTAALRHFRQHKLITSINVVCLTIGLVCFLTLYAAITYLQSGDRHFANSDRIYMLTWRVNDSPVAAFGPWVAKKYLQSDFPELKTVARSTFDSGYDSEVPVAAGDVKSFVHIVYADPEFLEVFSLPFLSGDSKKALSAPRSAVLSKQSATALFGSAQGALGKTLRMQDGRDLQVRGVIDELKQPSQLSDHGDNAMGTVRFDVMASMDVLEEEGRTNEVKRPIFDSWLSPYVFTYVLLPEDGSITASDLRTRLREFGPRHAYADDHKVDFGIWSVSDFWLSSMGALLGTQKTGISATVMFFFLGAVVLAISCLNYANLATAQSTVRAKEIGMRRMVGARRVQIIAQFMIEAGLQAFLALLAAALLVAVLVRIAPIPNAIAIVFTVAATWQFWTMLFALLLSVTVGAGLYPSFVLSSVRPIHAVRENKARGTGFMSKILVSLQFAGASFLLISMLVMVNQNKTFKESSLRSLSDPLIVVSNSSRAAGIDFEVLRSELLRQPHVQSVTATVVSPWMLIAPTANLTTSLNADARVVKPTQTEVNYEFFATFGVKLLAGRDFDRQRANDSAESRRGTVIPNVIIDRALAEQNGWTTPADALGKTVYTTELAKSMNTALPSTVIGVVENRPMTVMNMTGAPSNLYVLSPSIATSPIVRVDRNNPAAGLKEIEAVWNKLAPSVALKTRFADETLARSFRAVEGIAVVFSAIATLALIISVLGLIGMSFHVIGQRRGEIGIRKSLGASVQRVVRLLLSDLSKPVVIANLIAWPMAFFAMQGYLSIFTERTSLSFVPFAVALAITTLIAWISVAAQATRAARMNPASVLRHE